MTVRDVLVQIGFLMVTTGAMLAVWAVLTGQFSRAEPEAIPAEPAVQAIDEPNRDESDDEFEIPPIRRRVTSPRAGSSRAVKPGPRPAKAAKPKAAKPKAKSTARKPRPPE